MQPFLRGLDSIRKGIELIIVRVQKVFAPVYIQMIKESHKTHYSALKQANLNIYSLLVISKKDPTNGLETGNKNEGHTP